MHCPTCNAENRDDRRFCAKCGTALPVACPACGFANDAKDVLTLEFDQPVIWFEQLASQFYLDGEPGHIASGSTRANTLTLKLKAPSTAKHITYLKETNWNQNTLLLGANGLAALTFCEVPLQSGAASR